MADRRLDGETAAAQPGSGPELGSIIIQVNATYLKVDSTESTQAEQSECLLDLLVSSLELGWQDVNNAGIVFN